MDLDVAIIGAGPAGSTLAALLAGRGKRVAVADRDVFPRDKLCGEFLSYDALPILQPLGVIEALDAAGAPFIERCRIIGSRQSYEFPLPRPARGVSRWMLDELLLRTARRRGANCLEGAGATGLTRMPDGRHLLLLESGETLISSIVVGAWGRWGRFDRQLGRAFVQERTRRNFGFKRHYAWIDETLPQPGTIDLYSFRRGYLGVNGIEGGLTNVCGLVHDSRLAGHKGRWDGFVETLREEAPQLDRLFGSLEAAQPSYLSSDPVIFRARTPVEEGVFMIGDASGIVDPLTGNGMAMAIQSALLAAPLLLRLIENPSHRTAIESEYQRAHSSFFGRRIAWGRRAASLLSRPRLLETAMTVASSPRTGELLLRKTRAEPGELERMTERWFG